MRLYVLVLLFCSSFVYAAQDDAKPEETLGAQSTSKTIPVKHPGQIIYEQHCVVVTAMVLPRTEIGE